jgi:redox-sensitive bicupin YhaK (pirin superfamily)
MKRLSFIRGSQDEHWVGDGFPVRTMFSYNDLAEEMSPFLLLDYAGPADFPANHGKRGVGEHPHRGFETVTIVYDGEVEHRDSSGGGGKIGPGDVQWMTAAAGIVHEEFHGQDYARRGGPFEMVQLWVNLPKAKKMSKPGYQGITDASIPRVELPEKAGAIRVIAGKYGTAKGPAHTHSPMNVWDVRLKRGGKLDLPAGEGETTALFVLAGKISLPGGKTAEEAQLALFERAGKDLHIEAQEDAKLLYLNGKPLDEPIVGQGPFVMNTEDEIRQAFQDYRSGKMGHLAARLNE